MCWKDGLNSLVRGQIANLLRGQDPRDILIVEFWNVVVYQERLEIGRPLDLTSLVAVEEGSGAGVVPGQIEDLVLR
jgi:hypothetical protein